MIHSRFRHRIVAVALTSVILLASACNARSSGDASASSAPDGVQLVNAGKLTVCTNVPYEPFQFNQAGKVVGFDVDIVDLVAMKLNAVQEIVNIDFAVIKSGAVLNSGKCDLAAAGMTITEDRRKNIDFSVPYFDASQALMARKDKGLTSLDDVKTKRLRLGVLASTTGLDYVKAKGFDPVEFADSAKELFALQTGQVDAIVQDLPVVRTWLKKPEIGAKFEMVTSLNTGERYGFGMKKGNTALVRLVNESIEGARKDGTYNAIYRKWFGVDAPSPPSVP